MDRLTRRKGDILEFVDGKGYANLSFAEGQKLLFSQLAAYEDTGLSPEQVVKAIELLKEFAFYYIDASIEDHFAQAVKVQEFLKNTFAAEWLQTQLEINECDGCTDLESCKHKDGSCGF